MQSQSNQLSNVCCKCNHAFSVGEGRYLLHDGVYCVACRETPFGLSRNVPSLIATKLVLEVADQPKDDLKEVK